MRKHLEIYSGDLRVVVDRKAHALYIPRGKDIRLATQGGKVRLLIGDKLLEMTTPVAVKIGLALCASGGACMGAELVALEIGGEEFLLTPDVAIQVGGVLCRKADRADDFQRGISP